MTTIPGLSLRTTLREDRPFKVYMYSESYEKHVCVAEAFTEEQAREFLAKKSTARKNNPPVWQAQDKPHTYRLYEYSGKRRKCAILSAIIFGNGDMNIYEERNRTKKPQYACVSCGAAISTADLARCPACAEKHGQSPVRG